MNYTVYHLHSDLSTCVTSVDSVTKYNQYVDRAKECGMSAMAFSEHGSVFEWVKKKETVEKAGMKYIHAEEFYVTETLTEKIKDNCHIVIIAMNYDGVLELNKLSSKAFNRNDNHYYYVPRISMEELEQTSDNLMVTSACLASPLSKGNDAFKKRFLKFLIANQDRCYLEIQHHDVEEQRQYNKYLWDISKKYGIPLIAGTDTHALNAEHAEARLVLQKAKNIYFSDEEKWDLVFKTYDELVDAYVKQDSLPMDVVLEAIENTNRMADRVEEFTLDRSYKYPHLWDNPKATFIQKIKEGIKRRGVDKYPNRDKYAERVKYEIKAYEHNGAFDFMLLMEDIISWCHANDIPTGYGRGSVNGSVCAWLLGITEMDSIKHNLNFDRFMNVERVSLSDIDTDFPPNRIDEVKDYVFNHHGLYCSDIVTFNTIADKGAIRDVGRALEMPLDVVNDICDTVDDPNKYKKSREQYPELFKYVDICKGVIVSMGNHPCFTKDALVLTDKGYKAIDEIKVGDKVLTHDKRYKEVNDVIITENNSDFYNIKTGLLDIKATGNHPFYIRKPNSIRLRNKDYVNTRVKTYDAPEWIDTKNIQKGDMLGMPVNNNSIIPFYPQYSSLNFKSNNFWWIVGRYIGDGWVTCNTNRNTRYLVICCDHNGSELSEILTKIKLESFDYRVEDRQETYRIYIKNMELLEYLENFGKYADGKYLTNDILDLPREQLRAFIQGYMSADGSYIERDNAYSFSTVSKKLALGLTMCIAKVYMVHTTCTVIPAHTETLLGRTVNCKEKYRCVFHLDKRKKERNFYEDGYVWFYCYGVNYVGGIEKTYNLSVYDDNSYTVNNMAVHNCGMVVSPHPINDAMGLCTTSTDPFPISQIYMKEIDGLNYVKLDLLKLDTIQLIYDACRAANIDMLTPDNLDINDIDVWNSIRDNTVGIFQWEGATGDRYIKKLMSDKNIEKLSEFNKNLDRMTLLTIGNSAIRPAGASYRDDLANGVVRSSGNEAIDEFLKPTFGYLVFQCQIIEFLHQYCGFTMGEADVVRRMFAKKTGTEGVLPVIKDGGYLNGNQAHYIDGFVKTMAEKYNMPKEEAEESIVAFLQVILDASDYLFSVNHSQPYSYEGYACGWLRYHYPLQFLTCALNICKDDTNKTDKTQALTQYARDNNIKILSPKFRFSLGEYSFSTEENAIYKGISSVTYMSERVAEELYALRNNNYCDFLDLLEDMEENTSADSRQVDILIKLDFFSEFGGINDLLDIKDKWEKYSGRKTVKKDSDMLRILGIDNVRAHSGKETDKQFSDVNMSAILREWVLQRPHIETTIFDKIDYEVEYLGYAISTSENVKPDYWYVMSIDGYNKNVLSLYQICDGEVDKIKIDKNYKVKKGNVIHILEYTNRPRWRKVGEDPKTHKPKFEKMGETERVISKVSIIDRDIDINTDV